MDEAEKVANLSDVPPGTMKVGMIDFRACVVANIDGQIYVVEGTCTHMGGPLIQGTLEGEIITCPWHGGQFNVKTGQVVSPPPALPISPFEVVLEGNDIKVAKP